jgi:hypothetical protein
VKRGYRNVAGPTSIGGKPDSEVEEERGDSATLFGD